LAMKLSVVVLLCFVALVSAAPAGFYVLPVGTSGGVDDASLSGFAISAIPSSGNPQNWVLMDSGSFVSGLRMASQYGVLASLGVPNATQPCESGTNPPKCLDWAYFFLLNIKAYFISHPHLDHFSGLIIASASDKKIMGSVQKRIYAMPFVQNSLKDFIFNWISWPNMLSVPVPLGVPLSTYNQTVMVEGMEMPVLNTNDELFATAYVLSHSKYGAEIYNSTAFLYKTGSGSDARYILCFGDTAPDSVEGSTRLMAVWNAVAPLVVADKLLAIIIEVSYDNTRADGLLFGHFTPAHLNAELTRLKNVVTTLSSSKNIQGINVIISHIKTSLYSNSFPAQIYSELLSGNTNNVNFIIPQQGRLITIRPDKTFASSTIPAMCKSAASLRFSSSVLFSSVLFVAVVLVSFL